MKSCSFWTAALTTALSISALAQESTRTPSSAEGKYEFNVAAASDEAVAAIKKFQIPPGLRMTLFAAEPMLANPVAISADEKGRFFVAETFREGAGILDLNGGIPDWKQWLDEDLASKSVNDRLAEIKRHRGADAWKMGVASERISLIEDRTGSGRADHAQVFAEGFTGILNGIGAGILARNGTVWYADIPDLWFLKEGSDGKAAERKSLHYGFGVRVGWEGHDLHGVKMGPDGRVYFSMADRGAHIETEGKILDSTESGCVFRCNPDGSNLEIFATGLRNPQSLSFDQFGNLFTGDNNADHGDAARWVYVVDQGDSGWRIGYQNMTDPALGPWNTEKLWALPDENHAAYLVPPAGHIASGPAGNAYYPGTGLPDQYNNHFFLCDFRGSSASCVHSFALQPKGAGYELTDRTQIISGMLATDVCFAPQGGLFVCDWVEGWSKTGKGRIYQLADPAVLQSDPVRQTQKLLGEGMSQRADEELATLLSHPDMRVRMEAQFALASKGSASIPLLGKTAASGSLLSRLHAIWALEQIARHDLAATQPLLPLLHDAHPEVRAQSAKMLGERRCAEAYAGLVELLRDPEPRVRFFAGIALGKLGRRESIEPICAMLRQNANVDPYLRHAGVMALVGTADADAITALAKDASPAVRIAAVVALRRMKRPEIASFLADPDASVVLEAARAIYDVPISSAMPELATLLDKPSTDNFVTHRALNANLRLGTDESAAALARFSAKEDADPAMRVEALDLLARWSQPPGRDLVTGLWRPIVGDRNADAAASAFGPVFANVMHSSPDPVKEAALHAAQSLRLSAFLPPVLETLRDGKASPALRVAAINSLGDARDEAVHQILAALIGAEDPTVRAAALSVLARGWPDEAAGKLADTLQSPTAPIASRQQALTAIGSLPPGKADAVLADWLTQLTLGKVPAELQLELLEAAAGRDDSTVKQNLAAFEASRARAEPAARYQEALAGGNRFVGAKTFFQNSAVACVRCHMANGWGGEVGPNLSDLGKRQSRQYILESIVDPNKVIAPGFESVILGLKDGTTIAGVLKKEDDAHVELRTADGPVFVEKQKIRVRKKDLSAMPQDVASHLSRRELRDLVEFLAQQGVAQ